MASPGSLEDLLEEEEDDEGLLQMDGAHRAWDLTLDRQTPS